MTAAEFSNQFDVLYNNITSNQAPGLNEYEKSVFLTKAQSELVKNYFLSQSNSKQAGFDDNQKRQIDFSKLIRQTNGIYVDDSPYPDSRGIMFKIMGIKGNNAVPLNPLYIINESVEFLNPSEQKKIVIGIRQVIPIKYDEYLRLMSKPFKEPLKNQAWRLIADTVDGCTTVNIVLTSSDYNKYFHEETYQGQTYLDKINYTLRYVKKPMPIIVTDLSSTMEDITIEGYQGTTSEGYTNGVCCELDESLHEEILQRAVELAKVAWTATGNDNAQMVLQAGQRSE